ncbi:MAG: SIS domain-containing protein [Alphaproteobacteria bacterium]|nr:SIS domain-containing protein [Alphaproteobacteria bacterium]
MGLMREEALEAAEAARRLIAGGAEPLASVVAAIRHRRPRVVVVCGRGSSDHAGLFLRYLVETRLGLIASLSAPSVHSSYRRALVMDDALFVVISQSGRSPDLVAAARAARDAGALTVAIVNAADSPASAACEYVVPILAGPERSVAATKSVVNSMIAGARLVAMIAEDVTLATAIETLPARLATAAALDWSAWTGDLVDASVAVLAARGPGLAIALELSLKLAETARLPAIAHSAAELRHGPRAMLGPHTPVLALRLSDATAESVDGLVADLRVQGVPLAVAGGTAGTLPWIGDGDAVADAIAMLVPGYLAIEQLARQRGCDPDRPPFLSKVTETL